MFATKIIKFKYKNILKPILFLMDPEFIHNQFIFFGNILGKTQLSRSFLGWLFKYSSPALSQNIFGKTFKNPVGLAAGFDYNGKLTQVLDSVGFGFQSAGTVTYSKYGGNKAPRLARLPKSQSILVNKGFKNAGIQRILNKNMKNWPEDYQVGLSIGATNSKETATPEKQIEDILKSFKYVKNHKTINSLAYLELNISCPNVLGSGSLATPQYLTKVLQGIRALRINRPLIVKFQLEIAWEDAKKLIQIMIDYKVDGIVIANLLKDRNNHNLNEKELKRVKNIDGNFSGKPTFDLSNELIEKTYKEFGKRIMIIGCGGIFTAEDAYEKIKRGASLVQLITGMIYEGPQVVGDINKGLEELLKKDGFKNISEAVGTGN